MILYRYPIFSAICLVLAMAAGHAADVTRNWTDKQGRSFEGLLLTYDDEFVRVERTDDKRQFKLPRKNLSDADNAFLDGLRRQERVEKFLKDIPQTFDDAFDASVDDDMPVYIFYRNGASAGEFDGLVEKFVAEPRFQEFIKDKALVAVLREKDDGFEAAAHTYVNNSDRPCVIIIKGYRNHSLRSFTDTTMEQFMENMKELYKDYDTDVNY